MILHIANSKNFSLARKHFSLLLAEPETTKALPQREDKRFQEVGPGLFIGGYHAQNVLD